MSRAQLFLTLAVVAAALLAYDLLRGPPAVPPPSGASAPPAGNAATGADGRAALRLGDGTAVLAARLAALEHRMASLERGAGAAPSPGGASPAPLSAEPLDPAAAASDERLLAWFAALLQEVKRREQQTLRRRMVEGMVAGVGVALSPEERERVETLTLAYRDRLDQALAEASTRGTPEAERHEILGDIREAYRQALERELPLPAAERIFERLGAAPGHRVPAR